MVEWVHGVGLEALASVLEESAECLAGPKGYRQAAAWARRKRVLGPGCGLSTWSRRRASGIKDRDRVIIGGESFEL